mgnify:CR=1 FL=1
MAGWNLTGNAVSAEFDGSDEQERKELSVSQAVEIAAGALDAIPQLSVLGEVTGFRGPNARSGHCYFQIKDDSAAVDCIIWKGAYLKRTFDLRDGMQVSFKGSFNLYKATGRMSFVARSFSLAGEGLLRQQVAQLAEKLRREGLMDEARKRRIPVFWPGQFQIFPESCPNPPRDECPDGQTVPLAPSRTQVCRPLWNKKAA